MHAPRKAITTNRKGCKQTHGRFEAGGAGLTRRQVVCVFHENAVPQPDRCVTKVVAAGRAVRRRCHAPDSSRRSNGARASLLAHVGLRLFHRLDLACCSSPVRFSLSLPRSWSMWQQGGGRGETAAELGYRGRTAAPPTCLLGARGPLLPPSASSNALAAMSRHGPNSVRWKARLVVDCCSMRA